MSKSAMVSGPGFQPGLICHVEIENGSGTARDIDAQTAWALRELAAQIEAGKLDSGFHPVKTPSGVKIGEAYLDYYQLGPR
ncbi:MAG TPA: hypothetical protein VNR11_19630 [Xanthobacteraceae bacterium]|nr:hypothetical protein [Xanthobacteraceae bacterium]